MNHFPVRKEEFALAAIEAGCTLLPKAYGGPLINSYTPGFLRGIGYLPRDSGAYPEDVELAVIRARAKKRLGTITYLFVKDERFAIFWKAWNEMAAEQIKAEQENRPMTGVPPLRDVDTMAREGFMRAEHKRKVETELVWCVDSTCRYDDLKFEADAELMAVVPNMPAEKQADAREVASRFGDTTGTGVSWTLGLSNESRAAMNDKAGSQIVPMRQGTPEFYRILLSEK